MEQLSLEEKEERDRRRLNIVFHNVSESDGDEEMRLLKDIEKVKGINIAQNSAKD